MYELPFAKGLQYNAALASSEGANFTYIATPDEMVENTNKLKEILNQEVITDFDEWG